MPIAITQLRQNSDTVQLFFSTANMFDIAQAWSAHRVSGLSSQAVRVASVLGGEEPPLGYNLTLLDDTTRELLHKDSPARAAEYEQRLKDELSKVTWSSYGPRTFEQRFQIQYRHVVRAVTTAGFRGMWWILFCDLSFNFQGQLLHPRIPDLIARHPESITTADISHDEGRLLETFFGETQKRAEAECQKSLPEDTRQLLVELAKQAALVALFGKEVADAIECELTRKERERREAENEVERARRELRDARPIPGAEDHVDSFERNRDWISRTA